MSTDCLIGSYLNISAHLIGFVNNQQYCCHLIKKDGGHDFVFLSSISTADRVFGGIHCAI